MQGGSVACVQADGIDGETRAPGQEGEILDKMYPYIRGGRPNRRSITFFMRRVREHMDRSSTLDDLKTVEAALKNSIFDDVYGRCKNPSTIMEEDMADAKDPVNQQLKKNVVPSKEEEEEGIASPMNQKRHMKHNK